MTPRTVCLAALLLAAQAATAQQSVDELRRRGYSVSAITPVYAQLVKFSFPAGFQPAFQKDSGTFYIQEAVPKGETVDSWSQMITLTGSKGLAANPAATPQSMAQHIAGGFRQACPDTFAARGLGKATISGHEAFIALVGCGDVKAGKPHSEKAMIIAIKGSADGYTVQWAVRGAPIRQPPTLTDDEWLPRLNQLKPIQVCARIPGEPAPYPSCQGQKH